MGTVHSIPNLVLKIECTVPHSAAAYSLLRCYLVAGVAVLAGATVFAFW